MRDAKTFSADDAPNTSLYFNRSTGFWYANVYWPDTRERKRYSLHVETEAKGRAQFEQFKSEIVPRLIRDRQAAAVKAAAPEDKEPSLRELLAWYSETYLPQHAKPKTVQKYTQVLGDLLLYLKGRHIGRAQQLSPRVLQEWIIWEDAHRPGRQDGKHAPKSRRDALCIVRAWLNAAVRSGEIERSPIRFWDLPRKERGQKRALRLPELQECLAIIQERSPSIANLCRFLAFSGWRISDAMDLRWGEVEMDHGRIGARIDRDQIKTSDRLSYPVSPQLRECLQLELDRLPDRPRPRDYVFRNASGDPWAYNAVYRRLTRCLASAGFGRQVSLHTFRHSFATIAASGNPPVPPRVLQNLLGHTDVKQTLEYYTDVGLQDLTRWSASVTDAISPKTTENPVTPKGKPTKPKKGVTRR